MENPLVSVMTPCYNAAQTLPFALASLVAQSYQNWECLLVDDGSTDRPDEIVERINDPRIRYIRLAHNRGRAIARQAALDRAGGQLLAMLDADDWFYPHKIERQVAVLTAHPTLALVSGGMSIVDEQNNLIGVRTVRSDEALLIRGPLKRLEPTPVPHAPSIIRMELARQFRFDAAFHRSQDADFLLQLLKDRYYGLLPEIVYVYRDPPDRFRAKILESYAYRIKLFWKYRRRFPLSSWLQIWQTLAKTGLYGGLFAIGQEHWLLDRRSQPPTAAEIARFQQARRTVDRVRQSLFA